MKNGTLTPILLLAGVMLGLAGCASVAGGEEQGPYLTVYIDNFDTQPAAVYVTVKGQTIGRDDACSVPRMATRHRCQVRWVGTGTVVVEATLQNDRTTHSAELDGVSVGNRLCVQVRSTGLQLRRC